MFDEQLAMVKMDSIQIVLFLRYSPRYFFFYPLMEYVHLIVAYAKPKTFQNK